MPIVDKILKDLHGHIVNVVKKPRFCFGKELQLHVVEIKPSKPFQSPIVFEETMQEAVLDISDFIERKCDANLLGTGMHPTLNLEGTGIWPHRHRQIYQAYGEIFNLKRHGWLNIQSFQLNLPYADEKDGVQLHNLLGNICAYLPAIAASSPVYEGKLGECLDNRLRFYKENQREIPSVTGDVIPEYVDSFEQYEGDVIGKYSSDLEAAGADDLLIGMDWVNSRGVIFRFDRRALEIRVMDEQECIKSDVALSCFIRAVMRGLMEEKIELLSHRRLVEDFNAVVMNGINAKVGHPHGRTAREVCLWLLKKAESHASEEEAKYLPLVRKRIVKGSLSEILQERICQKAQRTDLKEAVVNIYSDLIKSLIDDEPYF